jgi:hypothetical protein
MSTSHLGRAVAFICGKNKCTARFIAECAGLHHTMLSRASHGGRLEAKSLRALCTSQPDPRDNLDLLVAHLRDEIERAGHSTHEIEINADTARIDDDLRCLLEEAKSDDQLAGMLRQLAAFVRTHPLQPENDLTLLQPEAHAAEDQSPWDPEK